MAKKINFYFIFLIIIGFVFIPNTYALTCDRNLPIINVESLPTASVDTLNNIYYYNGKFYSTTSIFGDSEIKIGDNLKGRTFCLLKGQEPFINYSSSLPLYFSYKTLFNNDYKYNYTHTSNNYLTRITFDGNYSFFAYNNNTLEVTSFNPNLTFTNDYIVTTLDEGYNLIKDYFGYCSSFTYEFITCDSSSVEMQKGKEIYLFFSSYDLKNLSIFENVDFSTFTTFQIILLTFAINILFILILLFFFYIGYKLIFKLWSIVKCLL